MIDGDEVARIDRGVLDRMAPEVRAVKLTPMEAVSRLRPERDPTQFKRKLTMDELALLTVLGVISEARGRSYFRGHITGKPGLRPAPDLSLGVHHVVEVTTGERVPIVADPGLSLLHYESWSGQEFVRKWTAMLGSGGDVARHQNRAPLARSVQALLSLDLDEADRAAWLETLYERVALDDVETLSRLGLLVEVDPDEGVRPSGTAPVERRPAARSAAEASTRRAEEAVPAAGEEPAGAQDPGAVATRDLSQRAVCRFSTTTPPTIISSANTLTASSRSPSTSAPTSAIEAVPSPDHTAYATETDICRTTMASSQMDRA